MGVRGGPPRAPGPTGRAAQPAWSRWTERPPGGAACPALPGSPGHSVPAPGRRPQREASLHRKVFICRRGTCRWQRDPLLRARLSLTACGVLTCLPAPVRPRLLAEAMPVCASPVPAPSSLLPPPSSSLLPPPLTPLRLSNIPSCGWTSAVYPPRARGHWRGRFLPSPQHDAGGSPSGGHAGPPDPSRSSSWGFGAREGGEAGPGHVGLKACPSVRPPARPPAGGCLAPSSCFPLALSPADRSRSGGSCGSLFPRRKRSVFLRGGGEVLGDSPVLFGTDGPSVWRPGEALGANEAPERLPHARLADQRLGVGGSGGFSARFELSHTLYVSYGEHVLLRQSEQVINKKAAQPWPGWLSG